MLHYINNIYHNGRSKLLQQSYVCILISLAFIFWVSNNKNIISKPFMWKFSPISDLTGKHGVKTTLKFYFYQRYMKLKSPKGLFRLALSHNDIVHDFALHKNFHSFWCSVFLHFRKITSNLKNITCFFIHVMHKCSTSKGRPCCSNMCLILSTW